jgi:3-oxoacyl-[acyl-carrier protein] reductase
MTSDIIVAGANGHFGKRILAGLKTSGYAVFGVDKHVKRGSQGEILECDFASVNQTREYFETISPLLGSEQLVLVLALGKIHSEPIMSLVDDGFAVHSEEAWDETIESNLKSVFVGTTAFAKMCRVKRRSGLVVAFSSVSADGNPGQVAYSSAKAGIEGFIRSVAKELGPIGIRAVSLAPGFFNTDSTRTNIEENRLAKVVRSTPLRRLGEVEELVSTISWLVENRFVTGTTIQIDGGLKL